MELPSDREIRELYLLEKTYDATEGNSQVVEPEPVLLEDFDDPRALQEWVVQQRSAGLWDFGRRLTPNWL